jgi:molybdate transport system substrate-binding protein
MADDLKILSAGAVKPGLSKVLDAFQRDSAAKVQISFATAPAILRQIGAGDSVDALIAPPAALETLVKSGKCAVRQTAVLGRIGIGVFVCAGGPLPRIGTVEDFKRSLLATESVVYNQASTGAYLEKLFETLGVGSAIAAKSTRYPDFAAVLDHVKKGRRKEIGLGATTVIIESQSRGIEFAGPLPAEIQNYTSYIAALLTDNEYARKFVSYLSSPAAKSLLTAAGIQ